MASEDEAFSGSIPRAYAEHLVPLLFEPYAADLAARLGARRPARVLEVAAGTGVVTRALARAFDGSASIVATDLNQAMLDEAAAAGTPQGVQWRQADAAALPFGDGSFDAVVCQFGAMFFPDRGRAFAEARRVLRPGGILLFNVWDRLAENEIAEAVSHAVERIFPDDPPRFLSRTPYGYFDPAEIARDVRAGGFDAPRLETVAARSRAASAHSPAIGYVQGTPLRGEIESRRPGSVEDATRTAAAEIERRFGQGPIDAKIQAHVVFVGR